MLYPPWTRHHSRVKNKSFNRSITGWMFHPSLIPCGLYLEELTPVTSGKESSSSLFSLSSRNVTPVQLTATMNLFFGSGGPGNIPRGNINSSQSPRGCVSCVFNHPNPKIINLRRFRKKSSLSVQRLHSHIYWLLLKIRFNMMKYDTFRITKH